MVNRGRCTNPSVVVGGCGSSYGLHQSRRQTRFASIASRIQVSGSKMIVIRTRAYAHPDRSEGIDDRGNELMVFKSLKEAV